MTSQTEGVKTGHIRRRNTY